MILEIPIGEVYSTRHPALDASGIYCFRNTRNGRRLENAKPVAAR